ncbi:uncharacterized protein N7503_005972 [Penicillium pulvis]|uniref:uncharacterized protein n=1 Tax=Penicillium pulvis TaxID=1562058 RepID=UPI0025490871|nr:uncharacterized protein N7503_005972 [Penicillium pulvis]KAJ5803522.1 hypothetical protein N7503_005972 [Penicillium pulvis]
MPQMLGKLFNSRVGYDDPMKTKRSEISKPDVAGETPKLIGTFPIHKPKSDRAARIHNEENIKDTMMGKRLMAQMKILKELRMLQKRK